jgi:hypothetical protein
MSTGALVVTTDASPMSDHVQPDRGLLVPVRGGMARHMAREYHVSADDLANTVRTAASLHPNEAYSISQRARQHILDASTAFHFKALELLKEL